MCCYIVQDGYTAEVTGERGVRVLVAMRAKPNRNRNSKLNRDFFVNFLNVSFVIVSHILLHAISITNSNQK